MFNTFPREVGPPRKIVNNLKEWLDFVNMHNGKKKAIYTSIYMFENIFTNSPKRPDYESAVVDKLFFDFDDKICNAWEECNKLHQECLNLNLKHMIIMSGRGYHLYIFCKEEKLDNKKEAIRGGQLFFVNKLNLTTDMQIIGNVAQMARVPNTYHLKARRFCIPLTQTQFEKGDRYVKNLALKQNFVCGYIGDRLFELRKFDKENDSEEIRLSVDIPLDLNTKDLTKDFPNCILDLIKKRKLGWKERYIVILFMKESGYTIQECYDVLKKYLTPQKLHHCIAEEKQLQYLYKRDDLVFPTCEDLQRKGYCKKKCSRFGKLIYKQ